MLKILVAEDDVSTNKLLCAILKINGYEAIPAFNGEAALDIIDHQHIDQRRFAVEGRDRFKIGRAHV